jgi:hypothetical protein
VVARETAGSATTGCQDANGFANATMPGSPASLASAIHWVRSWPVSSVSMPANARTWSDAVCSSGAAVQDGPEPGFLVLGQGVPAAGQPVRDVPDGRRGLRQRRPGGAGLVEVVPGLAGHLTRPGEGYMAPARTGRGCRNTTLSAGQTCRRGMQLAGSTARFGRTRDIDGFGRGPQQARRRTTWCRQCRNRKKVAT